MSALYGQAAMAGVQFAGMALGMETDETRATFNAAFASRSGKLAAARVSGAATRNIAAVEQDRIISNLQVQMAQNEAEASAKVSAAQAGATGGSVSTVINQTKENASFAIGRNNRKAEASLETLSTEVFNASMRLQSNTELPKSSMLSAMVNVGNTVGTAYLDGTYEALNQPTPDVGTARV